MTNAGFGGLSEGKPLDATSAPARKVKDVTSVKKEPAMDSVARAEARMRELRDSMGEGAEERDKFWAPKPPDGWDYQWKRRLIMGEEQASYQVELARKGWEAVPLSRHPDMMPMGWAGNTIEVEGLVLMERPKVLTQEARQLEAQDARANVLTKEAQLRSGKSNDLGQRQVHRFSKTREAVPIPMDE